ncbi:glycosyltransferase family 2 protein [Candidatus Woesebacteria bacterium]|nr:MAG: glycosyltransferase family 2 protein [Candidatus Woesebacteria bacterium]
MTNLSAIILTNNSYTTLKDCLASVSFCDEIIVIDDFSSDQSVNLARKMGGIVYERALNNNFSSQRNYGLSKAKGEWILFVDADEVVDKRLRHEILDSLCKPYDGYLIKRVNFFGNKKMLHGEVGNACFVRLAKKNKGKWTRNVHETWEIQGEVGILKYPILHYPDYSISSTLAKIDKYSSLHAQANKKEGKTSSLTKIVIFPLVKFINNYFFKLGFLDGIEGFIICYTMSFHSFLSWSRLWLNQKNITSQQ